MRRLRLNSQSGDTIVEVLIVLAVLSMSFAISYATANRGLLQSRNAQEHSEALGILNGQLEMLRAAAVQSATSPATNVFNTTDLGPFCMAQSTGARVSANNDADRNLDSTTGGNCVDANRLYHYNLVYDGAGTFRGTVRWNGVGTMGPQEEDMNYRLNSYDLSQVVHYAEPGQVAGGGGTTLPPTIAWQAGGADYGGNLFTGSGCYLQSNVGLGFLEACPTILNASQGLSSTYAFKTNFAAHYLLKDNKTQPGPATITIQYRQWHDSGNQLPPPNYQYNLQIQFGNDTSSVMQVALPIEATSGAYDPHSQTFNITVPAGVTDATNLNISWTNGNNTSTNNSGNAALQIDHVEIGQDQ